MTTAKEITLAFSGASGAPYGWRLLELLLAQGIKVHLLVSSAYQSQVFAFTQSQLSFLVYLVDWVSQFFQLHQVYLLTVRLPRKE